MRIFREEIRTFTALEAYRMNPLSAGEDRAGSVGWYRSSVRLVRTSASSVLPFQLEEMLLGGDPTLHAVHLEAQGMSGNPDISPAARCSQHGPDPTCCHVVVNSAG